MLIRHIEYISERPEKLQNALTPHKTDTKMVKIKHIILT